MSELAFNINGDPFDVPANAIGWRVRKMKAKGAPEVVYGRSGQPLVLPLEADIDDVRAEVTGTGRYRLDPVDDTNKPIEGAPAGYVYVHDAPAALAPAPASVQSSSHLPAPSDNVVIEAMRMNAEIAKSVVDRFPLMMEAAATLLRAADGAGLPAREPLALGDDGEDDEAVAPTASSPGFEFIQQLVAQVVPVVVASVAKKKMPNIASVFDWRKASAAQAASTTTDVQAEASTEAGDSLPALDPAMMGHFIAIQSALGAQEAALARQLAAELTPAEVRAWLAELSALSVPDAVIKIRSILAGAAKKGGAS
jgi:hypothetical protein